jgi:hypothetical protein
MQLRLALSTTAPPYGPRRLLRPLVGAAPELVAQDARAQPVSVALLCADTRAAGRVGGDSPLLPGAASICRLVQPTL